MRLDSYDFHVNPGILASSVKVPITVYKKFDKVKYCLSSFCTRKNLKIIFNGSSFSTLLGYEIFDLLPFILLENSTKYSPEGQDISVKFTDKNGFEEIEIVNLGPYVKTDEISKIFQNGFRGKWANNFSGTGIGLFFAKQICDIHRIDIQAQSGSISYTMHEVPYAPFKITLRYALSRKDAT
jgi:light-regulated signal transduction histidine kinase (bacteriophytochrome)